MAARKHFSALTSDDFGRHALWCCVDWPKSEVATPAHTIDNLETDDAYLAVVNYEMKDGTKARGYCFIYDDSGFALFTSDGEPIPVSTYVHCSDAEAAALSAALNRRAEDIFPIHYRSTVKVFGVCHEGQITLQPNSALLSDASTSPLRAQRGAAKRGR